jgi:NitT/TauT family transport system substrate-binding protein
LSAGSAAAGETVTVVVTPSVNAAPLMVGVEEGMFAANGLAVTPVLVALMPNLPAALLSGSGQIGLLSGPTLIQAVDGGLDLVAVAGGNVTSHAIMESALLASADFAYRKPSDLVGRSIGVPGIGAPQDVGLRYWMLQNGVDPAKVHFIETSIPQMADALRGHSVDAVIAPEPAQSQIIGSGVGKMAVPMSKELPEDIPWLFYVSTREWASTHPKELAAFRAGMAQAQMFTMTETAKAKEDFLKYVKMPPATLAMMSLGLQKPQITVAGLEWWVEVMRQQNMLNGSVDANNLVFK